MILDRFRMDGEVAIVTGGGRGIGRAMAVAFAEVGADVAVFSRTRSELEEVVGEMERLGRRGLAVVGDVRSKQDLEALVDQTVQELGRVDVLVNNAGHFQAWIPADQVSEEEWDDVLTAHLKAAFRTSRLVSKHMLAQKKGSIINVTSIAARVALPRTLSYTAAKWGMTGLTQSMAIDWAPYIRVNAIAPAFIHTPQNRFIYENPELQRDLESKTPMGRFGDAEEVAAAAVFLGSRAASYVTGETILVDGGWVAQ